MISKMSGRFRIAPQLVGLAEFRIAVLLILLWILFIRNANPAFDHSYRSPRASMLAQTCGFIWDVCFPAFRDTLMTTLLGMALIAAIVALAGWAVRGMMSRSNRPKSYPPVPKPEWDDFSDEENQIESYIEALVDWKLARIVHDYPPARRSSHYGERN